ncbi:hypothetical protein BOO71_0015220 [Deinococcus marmoris]|uniref:Uncharacterized protein n=1 Tax=Deinococcus marmoris TaxID=249408 RepID=A0A1U7NQZ8_9DEIO|nr:hypothetical protein BOO71_0015220 [Deinococcus marmoris]
MPLYLAFGQAVQNIHARGISILEPMLTFLLTPTLWKAG